MWEKSWKKIGCVQFTSESDRRMCCVQYDVQSGLFVKYWAYVSARLLFTCTGTYRGPCSMYVLCCFMLLPQVLCRVIAVLSSCVVCVVSYCRFLIGLCYLVKTSIY